MNAGLCWLLLAAGGVHSEDVEKRYRAIDLGTLWQIADDVAPSLNDSGLISMWTRAADGSVHSVLGAPGHLRDLGTLPGDGSGIGRALNNKGEVAGWSVAGANLVDSLAAVHAVVYIDGRPVPLGALGGRDSQAMAINDRGDVVGAASLKDRSKHAFLYRAGRLSDLGTLPGGSYSKAFAINDSGLIAGVSETPDRRTHATLWRMDRLIDLGTLPGGRRSQATAINRRGSIAGFSEAGGQEIRAFLYKDGAMSDLGASPVKANAINDADQIVGHAAINDRLLHAFLWQQGELLDLNKLLAGGEWELHDAFAINDRGQILSSASRAGKDELHLLLLNPAN
jgi:probable HAF family extracellular repeat protein